MAEEPPMDRSQRRRSAPRANIRGLILVGCASLAACEVFPLEVDTPQLNEHALEDLQNNASGGSCKPGTFEGNVTGGEGFTGQCVVHGNVSITGDATDLLRLRHVREVQGFIYVNGDVDLAAALPELRTCSAIIASGYAGLKLTSPASLETATSLTVEKNTTLQAIAGFDNVPALNVTLRNNAALTSVAGFAKVTKGIVRVEDNAKLSSFTAMPALTTSVEISFQRCPLLQQLPSWPALTEVENILVNTMPISAMTGFSALERASGIKLTQLPNLAALELPQLTQTTLLWLVELPKLATLAGLPKVQVSGQLSTCVLALCKAELDAFVAAHAAQAEWNLCSKWQPCTP